MILLKVLGSSLGLRGGVGGQGHLETEGPSVSCVFQNLGQGLPQELLALPGSFLPQEVTSLEALLLACGPSCGSSGSSCALSGPCGIQAHLKSSGLSSLSSCLILMAQKGPTHLLEVPQGPEKAPATKSPVLFAPTMLLP